MNFGKRMGYVGLSLLAFLAAIGVMLVAQFIVILPQSFMIGIEAGMKGITDPVVINEMANEAIMEVAPLAILISHLSMLLVFALWYRFGCGKPSFKKLDKKQLFAPKHILGVFLVGAGMNFFTNFAMSLVYDFIPQVFRDSYESMMETSQFGESALAIIAAVFIAPVGEELIFRGVAFYYAKKAVAGMSNKTLGFWIANAIQALFFGIMHMNVIQGTYAFILGLVLGYLAYRFGSVLPSILGHFLFNGISSFLMEPVSAVIPESEAAYAVVVVVSVIVVVAGLFLIKRREAVLETH